MRDAQSNFDQVISFSGEKIAVADVIGRSRPREHGDARSSDRRQSPKSQPKLVLDVVADLISRGQDLRNFCRDLLALFRDLMVFKVSGGDVDLVESSMLACR